LHEFAFVPNIYWHEFALLRISRFRLPDLMISIGAILLARLYSENNEKRQQVKVTIRCLFSPFPALIDCGLLCHGDHS
jgi:hypothetical protein